MIEKQITTPNLDTTVSFPLKERFALRIVFMGTPEFAVASLDKLVQAGCNIVGVITAPDKAAGRGMQLQQSAVKKYAVEHSLNTLQPEKLKDPEFLAALKQLRADLQIVVAFRMLPEIVWNMPPMGTINLHGSLLPQYRGAAPINWAIINGEKITGVTTFKLKHEIDTGDILLSAIIPIGEEETAGELHDKMKESGAALLFKTVKKLSAGNLEEAPQTQLTDHPGAVLKHAPKIFSTTCQIDWNKPVADIFNLVRGLAPYPAAFTFLEEKKLKLYKVAKVDGEVDVPGVNTTTSSYNAPSIAPGEFETDRKTFLHIAGLDGYISVLELQLEGKKKMSIEDFLRGYRWKNEVKS